MTGLVTHPKAGAGGRDSEFVGGDELVPTVGAAGQPAQHIFGADDREGETLQGAVEGGGDHQPAGLYHFGARATRTGRHRPRARPPPWPARRRNARRRRQALRRPSPDNRCQPVAAACSRAAAMLAADGIGPDHRGTEPRSGSHKRPPPQPMSRMRSPSRQGGARRRARTAGRPHRGYRRGEPD